MTHHHHLPDERLRVVHHDDDSPTHDADHDWLGDIEPCRAGTTCVFRRYDG